MWLKNGHNFCYMGHRRWLSQNHPFRFEGIKFDGKIELGCTPKACSCNNVLKQLKGTRFTYGKGEAQNVDINEKDEE